jgi:hypothetical protein
MVDRMPWDIPAAGADSEEAVPAARPRPGRHLIAVMLLTAALLIGAASAPQAAMSGFHGAYTIPDTATAVVGVLLAVAVLATAGAAGQPGQYTENSCTIDRGSI